MPLLIGVLPSIDPDPPALVVPSNSRLGLETRFTVRFPGSLAYEGARSGWAVHTATGGETFWALSPRLLPALVLMLEQDLQVPARAIRTAAQAVGALGDDSDETKERARIATTRLARAAGFRSKVLSAYGSECALCGLAVEFLLEAAHILPVKLPGSSDSASNGLPVCLHHHALLDSHMIHIDPADFSVRLSPELQQPGADPALRSLATVTRTQLTIPSSLRKADVRRWLTRRHEAFKADYGWL